MSKVVANMSRVMTLQSVVWFFFFLLDEEDRVVEVVRIVDFEALEKCVALVATDGAMDGAIDGETDWASAILS